MIEYYIIVSGKRAEIALKNKILTLKTNDMFWGISFIILGILILIYMRKDFYTDVRLSMFFSKKSKIWQGNLVGIVLIIIGLAQIINSSYE